MKKNSIVRSLVVAAVLALGAGQQARAAGVAVEQAWARSTVTGQQAGGAFLTVKNTGAADRLLGASTPAADHVELHSMKLEGDVMKMREVDAVEVPAGGAMAARAGQAAPDADGAESAAEGRQQLSADLEPSRRLGR